MHKNDFKKMLTWHTVVIYHEECFHLIVEIMNVYTSKIHIYFLIIFSIQKLLYCKIKRYIKKNGILFIILANSTKFSITDLQAQITYSQAQIENKSFNHWQTTFHFTSFNLILIPMSLLLVAILREEFSILVNCWLMLELNESFSSWL